MCVTKYVLLPCSFVCECVCVCEKMLRKGLDSWINQLAENFLASVLMIVLVAFQEQVTAQCLLSSCELSGFAVK